VGATACGQSPTVVAGAQEISSTPQQITFLGPVPVSGPRRELCFDFDQPRDSDKAATLRAVLLTTEGRRDTLVARVERRGESRACLVADEPSADEVARLQGSQYRGVELTTSAPPLHVKTIRWWSGR